MGAGTQPTGYEVIANVFAERFRGEMEARLAPIEAEARTRLDAAAADAAARVDELVARARLEAPAVIGQVLDTVPSVKADARNRSWRTLVQGLIATVIVGVGGAVGQAVAAPGFDITSSAALGTAGTAAGTAAVAALIAYVQRFIQPPKA